jgi:hypothetical protein
MGASERGLQRLESSEPQEFWWGNAHGSSTHFSTAQPERFVGYVPGFGGDRAKLRHAEPIIDLLLLGGDDAAATDPEP